MKPTYRLKEDQNVWNFVLSLFFIGVLIAAAYIMKSVRGGYLVSVPPYDAILMALATFRITRLVVYDKITRWFRELFVSTRHVEKEGAVWVEVVPHANGLRHTIYDLLQCPWCIGVWSSLVVVFCYFIFPWAWFVIFFLALAGAGSLIQITANAIGWKAENLKLKALERERNL